MSKKVGVSQKYIKEILDELREIPDTKLSVILRLLRLLKGELLPVSQPIEKGTNVLLDIDKFAINTGIPDLAMNHDHYQKISEKKDDLIKFYFLKKLLNERINIS